jgi:hypothetical protein
MRAYKFLNQQYGFKSLCERRLRRTKINELNDPFELRPYAITCEAERSAFAAVRKYLAGNYGLLCFSADWDDPVIWSHYSDKCKGICLGFDIPAEKQEAKTRRVGYIDDPLPFPTDFLDLAEQPRLLIVEKMLSTKYSNWRYEHEIRTFTDLKEEFFNFCTMLSLVEVVIGPACTIPKNEIESVLGRLAGGVEVIETKAADDAFQIVRR